MKNRIYIVARSNRDSLNVCKMLKEFGGGGHSQAASAVVRNLSMLATERKLKRLLEDNIQLETLAQDIMTLQ